MDNNLIGVMGTEKETHNLKEYEVGRVKEILMDTITLLFFNYYMISYL